MQGAFIKCFAPIMLGQKQYRVAKLGLELSLCSHSGWLVKKPA